MTVCVPRHGHADVTLTARGLTSIYGDQSNLERAARPRDAGVLVGKVALDGDLTVRCSPSS